MGDKVATFYARGAGGAEFELDELDPTSARGENLAGQIHKGDLVVLDKSGGNPVDQEKVDEMLTPFGLTRGTVVVGDPIIEGPGPAVPVDGSDPNRPQIGDAIPIEEDVKRAAPNVDEAQVGDATGEPRAGVDVPEGGHGEVGDDGHTRAFDADGNLVASTDPADAADGVTIVEADAGNGPPDGPAAAIVDWVRGAEKDHDPTDGWEDRARAALDVEQAKEKPGKGLLAKLEEIVAQADAPDDDTTTS